MKIYVIMRHDKYGESSSTYCALTSKDTADIMAKRLNEEEDEKEQIYTVSETNLIGCD